MYFSGDCCETNVSENIVDLRFDFSLFFNILLEALIFAAISALKFC